MEGEIFTTQDGSHSIYSPQFNVSYHSKYGALQESKHVFIQAGLYPFISGHSAIDLLEIGLGSGLNAFLTLLETEQKSFSVRYVGIENFPLPVDQARQLNYPEIAGEAGPGLFSRLHESPWEEPVDITPLFRLHKRKMDFEEVIYRQSFDLIYYDAFAPNAQPELWEFPMLERMYQALRSGGVLVTYCAKGAFKRHLKAMGFTVESLPGPPGKREMTRALK